MSKEEKQMRLAKIVGVVGCALSLTACARATVRPAEAVAAPGLAPVPVAEPDVPTVQVCVPGPLYEPMKADYLVLKIGGASEMVFRRVRYMCSSRTGIEFSGFEKEFHREARETCGRAMVLDIEVPDVIWQFSSKEAPVHAQPVLFTRTTLEEAILEVFRKNPCRNMPGMNET